MKIKYPFYILLVFISNLFLFSCNKVTPNLGSAANYLPATLHLQDGIVNKYYYHYESNDGYTVSTNIFYRSYQLVQPNMIVKNRYNPAMELVSSTAYTFQEEQMILLNSTEYSRGDTVAVEIIKNDFMDWDSKEASTSETLTTFPEYTQRKERVQQFLKDTLIDNLPAKIFSSKLNLITIQEKKDTQNVQMKSRLIFVKGLGDFSSTTIFPDGVGRLELVEQITSSEFEKKRGHGLKRVAYIDPSKVMDKNNDFRLCEKEEKIVDYYNGVKLKAEYRGGKRALWRAITAQMKPEKLKKESGYLTFRFVVNCRGEAGWFITEEADLDFQEKQFNRETINHFFEITTRLDDWSNCVINKKDRDAYIYLTYKLKNGELIDILP